MAVFGVKKVFGNDILGKAGSGLGWNPAVTGSATKLLLRSPFLFRGLLSLFTLQQFHFGYGENLSHSVIESLGLRLAGNIVRRYGFDARIIPSRTTGPDLMHHNLCKSSLSSAFEYSFLRYAKLLSVQLFMNLCLHWHPQVLHRCVCYFFFGASRSVKETRILDFAYAKHP